MKELIKLVWDFKGPTAEQTAIHHVIHLKEYATIEKLYSTDSDIEKVSDDHYYAYLVVCSEEMKFVRDALKPHRGLKHSL